MMYNVLLVGVNRFFALLRMTLFVGALMLCGCRTEYVPIESVRYDSLMIEKLIRDSVFVRDSVYIQEKGDTIYKYKDKYVYVYKNRVDTFYMEKIREREVPVPVERKLTWWERVKLEYAEWVFGMIVAIALIYALRQWLARKIRKE